LAAAKTVATSVYHRGGSGGGGDKREDGYPRAGTASAAAARLVRAVVASAGSHATNYLTDQRHFFTKRGNTRGSTEKFILEIAKEISGYQAQTNA
jgi:hypothetical protein